MTTQPHSQLLPSVRETVASLFGVYLLAKLEPSGMAYLDRSATGAQRSFLAVAAALPVFLLMEVHAMPALVSGTRGVVMFVLGYVVSWAMFGLAMQLVAREAGREEAFAGYFCAYNWSLLLVAIAYLPLGIVAATGLMPEILQSAAISTLLFSAMAYWGYLARAGLGLPISAAIGVVLLEAFISLIVGTFTWLPYARMSPGG